MALRRGGSGVQIVDLGSGVRICLDSEVPGMRLKCELTMVISM